MDLSKITIRQRRKLADRLKFQHNWFDAAVTENGVLYTRDGKEWCAMSDSQIADIRIDLEA